MKGTSKVASAVGQRPYQEDYSTIVSRPEGTILAVADGHGGDQVSRFLCSANGLEATWEEKYKPDLPAEVVIKGVWASLQISTHHLSAGACLSLVFIPHPGNRAYIAVSGDAPVLIRLGEYLYVGPDHNVRTNSKELRAAVARGGVAANGYVWEMSTQKGLQMARAFGDAFMGNLIDRDPEIQTVDLQKDSWILVASDGLFDPGHTGGENTLSHALVAGRIDRGATAEELVQQAVDAKTGDNATALLWRPLEG